MTEHQIYVVIQLFLVLAALTAIVASIFKGGHVGEDPFEDSDYKDVINKK